MPTTTADQPQGPSLADAAKRMEGLLDLEEKGNQDTSDQAADEAPADEKDEGVAADAKSEETTAPAETDEAEATEAKDETETADVEEPQMVTIKIDGKTETVPLEEALSGYQRHRDYSRKTADLANVRREVEQQAETVKQERQTYATMLVALRDQLQSTQPQEPNWDEVYKTDPIGYARQRDEWRDKQDKIAAANFELQRVQSLQQKDNAETLAKMVQDGRAKMLDENPSWKDHKVWEADRSAIVEYALKVGYSREEIAQAYDPRAVLAMHKARLYDELMAKKPQPVLAKGPKVASAGAASQGGNYAKLNAAQQRLAKSGRIDDAAKVFEQLL
jgi:hypothetical protein